jgi:chemotaxis protein CheX
MDPSEADLERIAGDIWAAMLGLELKPHHELATHDPDERVVTGLVQITGDWEGAVSVQASERFARRAAGLMFAMEEGEVDTEEINDTIGELANMTGGNVKSLIEGSCQLSLPSVTSGRDYAVSLPGTKTTGRLSLDCDEELVVMTLLQRQGS